MWQELVIIALIILVSYVFAISDRKMFDNQLMFIIIVLFILVIYSTLTYRRQKSSESFTVDLDLTKITSWLAQTQSQTANMTAEQATQLASDYSNIRSDVATVKQLLQGINAQQAASSVTPPPMTTYDRPNMLNLASYQTLQRERIQDIQNTIADLKTQVNQQAIKQSTVDYPKIPVYSSCIVAEANGAYTASSGSSTSSAPGVSSGSTAQNSSNVLAQMVGSLLSNGVNVSIGP